jgi:uncharacterized iron-regulated protein
MRLSLAVAACLLAGCATLMPLADIGDARVVLLGEQHDADSHRTPQERWVAGLAARGQLAALALEMAERGASTTGLARSASEAEVQQALRWQTEAWPWERYRPAVMAAVRAGVPVLGANLPRAQMRDAMRDAGFDRLLPGAALKAQQQAIRIGHCELLPEHQITPMTRVQVARDQAMAQVIESAVAPGKVVVLIAGSGHVQPDLGVPQHLPAALPIKPVLLPPEPDNGKDHCAALRRQFSQ